MSAPSGTCYRTLAKKLPASTCTERNTRLGSRPMRGGLQPGSYHGTWDGTIQLESLREVGKRTDLGSSIIATFLPIIGLFLCTFTQVRLVCIALLRGGNVWYGRSIDGLPGLRLLEGGQHHEDGFPVLDRAHCTRGIRATIADAVHVVENWGGKSTQHKVALL
jgi:hypothetical protein